MSPGHESDVVSTVVRFHDPAKLEDLSIALMCLAGQTHGRVEPVVVTQDFSGPDEARVRELCNAIAWPKDAHPYQVVNVVGLGPGDHRAELANAGIAARSGRYLAFLDYDDVIYGRCYSVLLERLRRTGSAVAFVGVLAADVETGSRASYTLRKYPVFATLSKYSVFVTNRYPIHSWVMDTKAIEPNLLRFDAGHSKNEDYAFLLRILAVKEWDVGAVSRPLAEYAMRIDGSNTIRAHSGGDKDKRREWERAERYIADLKSTLRVTVPCEELIAIVRLADSEAKSRASKDEEEQRSAEREARLAAAEKRVRELESSATDMRALASRLANAERRVANLESSTSWRVTAPLRAISRLAKRLRRTR